MTANLIISFILQKELGLSLSDLEKFSEQEIAAYLILLDESKRMQQESMEG